MEQFQPFYVGQEVEAVKTHSQGHFKKGDKFSITGVYKSDCLCPGWDVTIGVQYTRPVHHCSKCRIYNIPNVGEHRFYSGLFRPITPAMQAVTFEKITEQHPVSVN